MFELGADAMMFGGLAAGAALLVAGGVRGLARRGKTSPPAPAPVAPRARARPSPEPRPPAVAAPSTPRTVPLPPRTVPSRPAAPVAKARPVPAATRPAVPAGPMTEADRLRVGDEGEARVKQLLERLGLDYDHTLNFRAKSATDGRTVQVDILARLKNGQMVDLEIKNYGGEVTGNPNNKFLLHNGKQFLNPIVQSEWQCAALKQRLGGYQPHHYVVFVGNATFPRHERLLSLKTLPGALQKLGALPRVNTAKAWEIVRRDLHDDTAAVEHVDRMQARGRKKRKPRSGCRTR